MKGLPMLTKKVWSLLLMAVFLSDLTLTQAQQSSVKSDSGEQRDSTAASSLIGPGWAPDWFGVKRSPTLNLAGTGTVGTIPKWVTTDTIGDSIISEAAGAVLIGGRLGLGTTPTAGLHILNLGSTSDRTDIGLDTTSADFRRRSLRYLTNGQLRFAVDVDNAAEGSGNAGSVFGINAYDNSGNFLRTMMTMQRGSGLTSFVPGDLTAQMTIGTGTPDAQSRLTIDSGSYQQGLRVQKNSGQLQFAFATAGNLAFESPVFNLVRYGGTLSSPTAVQANYDLFTINSVGYDGSTTRAGSNLKMGVAANWTTTSRPTFMSFATHPANNDTQPTERVRIDENGQVGLGTTAPTSTLDINGAITIRGASGPGVSPGGQGRVYFDTTTSKFRVSENGGSYVDLLGGGGGIASLNGLTAGTQGFANDANVTMTSAGATHTLGWSGLLSTGRGGTGVNGSGAANGQLLIGNGAGFSLANLTAGSGISITNAAGGITIGAAGGSGITTLNSLTGVTQTFATGVSGSDFNIVSSGTTHTFNVPDAGGAVRGLVTTGSQTFGGTKLFGSRVGIGATTTPTAALHITNLGSTSDRTDMALDTTSADFRRRSLRYMTNGQLRFAVDVDNAAEGSGNSGSIFGINAYDNTGNFLRTMMTMQRGSGLTSFLPNDANAQMTIGTATPDAGARLTIDSGGYQQGLRVQKNTGQLQFTFATAGNLSFESPVFNLVRYGGTLSSPTAVQANHDLFTINSVGYDGSITRAGANLKMVAAATWTGSSKPTFISFATHPANNDSQPTERMRIDENGQVGIGTTSPTSAVDLNGALTVRGIAAPGTSVAGQGRVYFDTATSKFKVSENGGAFVDLLGGGGGGGGITSLNGLTGSSQGFLNDANVTMTSAGATHSLGWSGLLSTGRGGTGVNGSGAANGQLLIGNGAGFSLANLTAGSGISITNAAGGVTIAATGGGGSGITSLNSLTGVTQTFATGASGSDFNIVSSGTTHTFNVPDAGAAVRGLVSIGSQTFSGTKLFSSKVGIGATTTPTAALHITNLGSTSDRTDMALDTTSADFRRRSLRYMTNGALRWALDTDTVPETGGNTGSVFGLNSYADDGSFIRNVFGIRRNDGAVIWLSSANPANLNALTSIGATDVVAGNKLTVRGTVGTVLRLHADTASTNTRQTAVNALASTSGVMADGFGPQMMMQVIDNVGATSTLGLVGAERNGDNNSGALVFHTSNAGSTAERVRVSPTGQVGLGTNQPTSVLDVNGAFTMRSMAAPSASAAGQGRIYFDTTDNKFKVSENGGAYVDLVSGGSGFAFSPATDASLLTVTDKAVEVRAGAERALRIEPSPAGLEGPNLIGGSEANGTTAGAVGATIGGGGAARQANRVSDDYGTVSGGLSNRAGDEDGTTSDSRYATVGGGFSNAAIAEGSTVSGGESNIASGTKATVTGGSRNVAAGDFSVAAGRRVKIAREHSGAILLSDSTDSDFASVRGNEFAVRATGGVRFSTSVDANGDSTSGVELAPGSGSWSSFSDRNAKQNFAPIDGREVLRRLIALPIQTWSYKGQGDSVRHVGPTAQDFHAAFRVGENDTHISAVDADGVALAAVKGLYDLSLEKDQKIERLSEEVNALKTSNDELQKRLAALEKIVMESQKK